MKQIKIPIVNIDMYNKWASYSPDSDINYINIKTALQQFPLEEIIDPEKYADFYYFEVTAVLNGSHSQDVTEALQGLICGASQHTIQRQKVINLAWNGFINHKDRKFDNSIELRITVKEQVNLWEGVRELEWK